MRAVCGRDRAYGDSTCLVRRADRVRAGYRFVIVRRPPIGNDALAVVVQGRRVSATPIEPTVLLRVRVLDSISGRPVTHAGVQTIPWTPLTNTDEHGRVVLHGVRRESSLRITCPAWQRPLGSRIWEQQLSFNVVNDTEVVARVSTAGCVEHEPRLDRREFRGHYTSGFEASDFHPCGGFLLPDSIPAHRQHAWVRFAPNVDFGRLEWPSYVDTATYPTVYVLWQGTIRGPGHYGHLGGAAYEIVVDKVLELRAPNKEDCGPTRDSIQGRR